VAPVRQVRLQALGKEPQADSHEAARNGDERREHRLPILGAQINPICAAKWLPGPVTIGVQNGGY
jgi:hypothetical protein